MSATDCEVGVQGLLVRRISIRRRDELMQRQMAADIQARLDQEDEEAVNRLYNVAPEGLSEWLVNERVLERLMEADGFVLCFEVPYGEELGPDLFCNYGSSFGYFMDLQKAWAGNVNVYVGTNLPGKLQINLSLFTP